MRFRHVCFYKLLRPLVRVFLWVKFGYRAKTAKKLPENYMVLSNHVTDWDPLFVAMGFPRQMYFVASEHISRWKRAYRWLRFWLAPILRKKGTIASSTVIEMMRKLKNGQNVCVFAEGARTWDGVTGPILPATAKLIQTAKCGLVTYRIVGGYFVSPNWSEKNLRRGKIYGEPVGVYSPEELAQLSMEELQALIERDLFEDAYARQVQEPLKYRCKRPAEKLENLLFLCPHCGAVDTMCSHGDTVSCTACDFQFTLDEYGMLRGTDFDTVKALAGWQRRAVDAAATADVCYTSPDATLTAIGKNGEEPIATGAVAMDAETFSCGAWSVPMGDIKDLAMHGRHAIVFTAQKNYYELLIPSGSNALKFHLLYQSLLNKR